MALQLPLFTPSILRHEVMEEADEKSVVVLDHTGGGRDSHKLDDCFPPNLSPVTNRNTYMVCFVNSPASKIKAHNPGAKTDPVLLASPRDLEVACPLWEQVHQMFQAPQV